jgi:hypothetical protein
LATNDYVSLYAYWSSVGTTSQFYGAVGAPGTALTGGASGTALPAITKALALLNKNDAPKESGRKTLLNDPDFNSLLAQSNLTYFNPGPEISKIYSDGYQGDFSSFRVFMNQLVEAHTNGTFSGTPVIASTVASNSTWSTTSVISVSGFSGATALNAGDVLTIAGVYMVNPQAGLARYMAEADPSVLQYSQRTGKTELPIVYHGTASPENFKGFDIRDNAYYDPHHSGYNGFVAEDHNFASDYANNGGGGGIPNLEALAAAGHEGLPAGPRVLPMRFGPRKLYDPRTPEGQQVATDWFSSPEGRALYDTNPRLRERLLGDYYHGPGSMLSPEQRQAYVDQNLFAHHVANPQANWVPMEIPEFVDHLRSKGYDAAALREAGAWNYGLLDPGAVKSSVGNVGTYDRSNPDLLKADGGAVTHPVSAFRAAYPGANPAYGTKPVVVNGKTLQVSADPDIVARAREAMQRLQDQMSADSARRAAGLGVPSSQYGQKPQYADGGLAAKYGVTRIAFADGGLKGELGEVASGIGDAITGAVKDTVGTPQVAAAADIPRVFGTIRNSVGATPNALRAAGVPDDMARSMAQAAQTDTLGPKQINEALRARESYLAEPNVTPGPQASDDAWRQWGEQHGVNMTVTPHQEIAPGIRVPGGTGGTFTIPDLFDMKANTFDVKNLTPEQHEALMQKMIRTYGTADDPVNAYNRLVFSQMSPKAPLLTNEFLASRVRARTPEDLFAHAAGTGDVGKQYGLQSAGAGGMGLRGTPDPNATRQLASVLSENPSLVKAAPGETTRDVALRLMNQVPLFSQKTASLGAPLLDLANGSTSPVDLHVIRNNWRQILEDPQYGPDFKQSLAKKFGVEPTTDAITAAYDAAPGKGLDTVRSVVEQKTNGKYRLKGGELNPRIPDAITPDRLGTEPDMFQDFGPLYDRFSKQLENDRIGNLPLFANQWAKWDGYRGRFEPHEVLHPDYVNLPKQSFQEMRAALQANRAAGFADESGFREGHGLGWKDLYYGHANPDLLAYLALGTGLGAAGWKAWNNAHPDPKQSQSPAP